MLSFETCLKSPIRGAGGMLWCSRLMIQLVSLRALVLPQPVAAGVATAEV